MSSKYMSAHIIISDVTRDLILVSLFQSKFIVYKNYILQKTKFHRPQTLGWRNGYALPTAPEIGIGGDAIPVNKLTQEELDELANIKPSLTYGQKVQAPPEDFVPAHVAFDKKVLLFFAYFKQTVHESANEHYRVRPVKIYYYLEDDSIAVVEPVVENRWVVLN